MDIRLHDNPIRILVLIAASNNSILTTQGNITLAQTPITLQWRPSLHEIACVGRFRGCTVRRAEYRRGVGFDEDGEGGGAAAEDCCR